MGRWASARGLPRAEGHRRGADAARRVVEAASEVRAVQHLTLFSFSSEKLVPPPGRSAGPDGHSALAAAVRSGGYA